MSAPATAIVVSIAATVLTLGVGPPVLVRALARVYPGGHPRRRELIAELAAVPHPRRPTWAVGLVAVCLAEAIGARYLRWRQQHPFERLLRAISGLAFAVLAVAAVVQFAPGRPWTVCVAAAFWGVWFGYKLREFAEARQTSRRLPPSDRPGLDRT